MSGQSYRGQIADLNIMPRSLPGGGWELVIGSGYLFVGMYPFEADQETGELERRADIQRAEELATRAFLQVVARVYRLPIDIDAVLQGTDRHIDVPSRGCVRSWTPDDRELRTLLPTAQGGVLLIDGGGNTGSTTKAPFVSRVARTFIQAIDQGSRPDYESVRASLRKTRQELGRDRWQELEQRLNQARSEAR
ncbi:MAG TPA: hypothetical protein VFX59_29420 [Polyangiales bacterium]|nr:hypothetical protein [Polyangiales bacterium]